MFGTRGGGEFIDFGTHFRFCSQKRIIFKKKKIFDTGFEQRQPLLSFYFFLMRYHVKHTGRHKEAEKIRIEKFSIIEIYYYFVKLEKQTIL
jgi:hypothetical protein